MRETSYFPPYSKGENQLTNYTLLILRHFYLQHPQKLEKILFELSGEDVDIGPSFKQQIKESQSIPDALISQQSLKMYFEVKDKGELMEEQIERHIQSIKSKAIEDKDNLSVKILFALTADPIACDIISRLEDKTKGHSSDLAKDYPIVFKAITFNDVIRALEGCCEDYEVDLKNVLNDYEQYLRSKDLLSTEYLTLVSVKGNREYHEKFRLYHREVKDPKISSKFLGLYENWCVKHIGRVEAVVRGGLDAAGKYKVEKKEIEFRRDGYELEEGLELVTEAIRTGKFPTIGQGHRFYLLSELKDTHYCREPGKGGAIRHKKNINLSNLLDPGSNKKEYDLDEVAERLRGEKF